MKILGKKGLRKPFYTLSIVNNEPNHLTVQETLLSTVY